MYTSNIAEPLSNEILYLKQDNFKIQIIFTLNISQSTVWLNHTCSFFEWVKVPLCTIFAKLSYGYVKSRFWCHKVSIWDTVQHWCPAQSTWCHARDSFSHKCSQAFPICFCILQAIKNWRREWPGNEANSWPYPQMVVSPGVAVLSHLLPADVSESCHHL